MKSVVALCQSPQEVEKRYSMSRSTVVIYGPIRFPHGDASGNRVYHLAKLLRDAGWDVLVIGKGTLEDDYKQEDGRYCVDGIEFDSIYQDDNTSFSKILKLVSGGLSYKNVWGRHGIDFPYAVISYSNYFSGSYALREFCRKESIPFIADVVEWFSPGQFKLGLFSLTYINNQLGIHTFRSLDNIIVISRFLETYFSKHIRNVVRIPPVVDVQAVPYTIEHFGADINLLYAGNPRGKDLLSPLIQGIKLLSDNERNRIQLDIYGLDTMGFEQYIHTTIQEENVLSGVEQFVRCHGRVSHKVILDALPRADFSVLLRPQLRYANAGFPSKIPESLAAGTPVLLNNTSDLAFYIRDAYEGIIIENPSACSVANALRKVLALSRPQLNAMRVHARRCAEQHFDYRNYIAPLKSLLERSNL